MALIEALLEGTMKKTPFGFGYHMKNEDDDEDENDRPRRRASGKTPQIVMAHYDGNTQAMAGQIIELEEDNKAYRDQRKELRARVKDLESQLPAEGSVVLSADEAKQWEIFKSLGKADDIKKKVDSYAELQKKVAQGERVFVLASVAKDLSFDLEVLKDLDSRTSDLSYVKKDAVDPETRTAVPTWFVQFKDGDVQKEEPVSDYYERLYPKFVQVLKLDGQTSTSMNQDTEQAGNTGPFQRTMPTQRAGNGQPPKPKSIAQSVLADYAEQRPVTT